MSVLQDSPLQNKICLVTGATSGMGKATALELARRGGTVLLVTRNQSKGERVLDEIRDASSNATIDLFVADLSSMCEVVRLADEVKARHQALHVLVNNAGGIFFERMETVDSYEYTFALNHLAYFQLTNLLLDLLKASAPARIINISSFVEKIGKLNFADLHRQKQYSGFAAYAQSKLANLLFTYDLARRLDSTGVTVNAVGPNFVKTNFAKNSRGVNRFLAFVFGLIGTSAEKGAETIIYLASSPEVEGVTGKFFYHSKERASSPQSHDRALQEQLWQASVALLNLVEVNG
ncbi:MAG: SDR family oxidoreductase [Ktedonobacteraceae bacterium]|nr:SDR family oxidoreductase [Ktedonobacteraceae bacterium]